MQRIYLFLFVLYLAGCNAQTEAVPSKVPYHRDPETPSMEALELLDKIDASLLVKQQTSIGEGRRMDYYYLDGVPYTGWSYQAFKDTDHKYRYIKYEMGQPVWQIGYFENGQLDHDFHMKDGKSLGSERMWRGDGSPYINYFYSAPGAMDGLQRRWHPDSLLARYGFYEDGEMIYEIFYDKNGVITETQGNVPENMK